MSYVGGPGYELYASTDQCVTMYDALWSAGASFGLRDAGYYTIDALRIEAGRRAWGAELGPDETPWEAGLGYAVKTRQASAVRRPRRVAPEARGSNPQAPHHVHLDDPRHFRGARAHPHGWRQRRRADLRGLQPPLAALWRWATPARRIR
jgi:glycine cleavage system aminomethyltransferase T